MRLCAFRFHSIANPFVCTQISVLRFNCVVCVGFFCCLLKVLWRVSRKHEHFMHLSNDNDFKITQKELKDDISKSFWNTHTPKHIHKASKVPTLNTGGKFSAKWKKGLNIVRSSEQITEDKNERK